VKKLTTTTVLIATLFASACVSGGQSGPTSSYCLTQPRPSVSEATLQAMSRDELEALDDAITYWDLVCGK
jgi:hypothetical protein